MFDFGVLCPAAYADARLAIAAGRAGALGLIDLQYGADASRAGGLLAEMVASGGGRWGVQVADDGMLDLVLSQPRERMELVVLAQPDPAHLDALVARVHRERLRAFAVATTADRARAAEQAGADGVIAKGCEAGGWVGDEGSMILLQRIGDLSVPVWAQGGIGIHTIAAARIAGAEGAVLEGQVLLARESPLQAPERRVLRAMDGSETVTLGAGAGPSFRVYGRPGVDPVTRLAHSERETPGSPEGRAQWEEQARAAVGDGSVERGLLVVGQDASSAGRLADRYVTVAGILDALRDALVNTSAALAANPLAEGAPLAQSHGTRYPIVQGPMTRVSDRAAFASAVADAGALPFIALALMRAPEADAVLRETSERLGDRPWGVGILGFVPPALRAEQLEVVRAHRPPFMLIAGGRPDQAQEMERDGMRTYLHVPSPVLLRLYLAQGARRFVFEGRECGGHVGPRTSFALWEAMLGVLDDELPAGDPECHVLFAGGIHDARSAAMVAAMAAGAAARGIKCGVLLGTAYLFTREATAHGAVTDRFQRAAIETRDTVLLESGPGHATRCAPSPFVEQFAAEKRQLHEEGVDAEELRARLELLNVGRLRIAAKGVDRNPDRDSDPDAPKLVPVGEAEQWRDGMFMIGQVASLRDAPVDMADLHHDVSAGSGDLLRAMRDEEPVGRVAGAPDPADVAIVGLACILPGAPDATAFWANILEKVDAIREVPRERWDWQRFFDPDPSAADKVVSRWGGFIDPVPFDPIAWGLPPKSLASIEPFQLLALITAQRALHDAGYARRPFDRERTSVILGAGGGGADLSVGYTVRSALPSLIHEADVVERVNERLPEWTEDSFAGLLMNVAAGRIANRLDLGGTNFTVDAACASS
ncbi:MAG: beta-ketoacyl synthase N-terminal-like domain-containing protein, partial [Solirubrobacteraceae bacterium]